MPPAAATGLKEVDVLALTIYHEAAREGLLGMAAVGCVIQNRAEWGKWGPTTRDVCLAPAQFSCWRPAGGTTNYASLVKHADRIRAGDPPARMHRAYDVAYAILDTAHPVDDPTNDADHYYAPQAMVPPGRVPTWAKGKVPSAAIGRHIFYRLRPA